MEALALAAFSAGLLGGVHCAGMCGGIVASLSAGTRGPMLPRHLAFNAGRIGSYAAAGAVAGLLGNLAQMTGPVLGVQLALFVAANLLMILLGLYIAGWSSGLMRLEAAGGALWRRVQPLGRRLVPVDTTARALGAGALWGWVPCGLVYSMLALSLASGSVGGGALVVLAFGLGTLPNLLAAGYFSQKLLALRRVPWVRRTAGGLIILLALFALARVPFIREAIQAGWAACAAAIPA